jgi:hypothetical protein
MQPQGINIEFIFQKVYELLSGGAVATSESIQQTIRVTYTSAFVAIVVLLIIIFYYVYRIYQLKKEDEYNFKNLFRIASMPRNENERWENIVTHMRSDNPALWRIAILEADMILDELLRTLGYQGEGIGEMLRQVERGDMLSLDNAWQAHKVRNKIAHEGYNFGLSENDAHKVIAMYKTVFEEFSAI